MIPVKGHAAPSRVARVMARVQGLGLALKLLDGFARRPRAQVWLHAAQQSRFDQLAELDRRDADLPMLGAAAETMGDWPVWIDSIARATFAIDEPGVVIDARDEGHRRVVDLAPMSTRSLLVHVLRVPSGIFRWRLCAVVLAWTVEKRHHHAYPSGEAALSNTPCVASSKMKASPLPAYATR